MRKKAFTLTELLVVVIVLGVLAAVAVPKFSRVLETRKTSEAEEIFSAVRTEQENRCVFGKEYLTDASKLSMIANLGKGNYSYTLSAQGIAASSGRGYELKMPSYKDGVICCEGDYCESLNKSYPLCSSLTVAADECAAEPPAPQVYECSNASKPVASQSCGNCGTQTRSVSCDTSTGDWVTGSWSSCSGQGVCSAGATKSEACASGLEGSGKQYTCSNSCQWELTKEDCAEKQEAVCQDGETSGEQSCNGCGTQTTMKCVDGQWTMALGECSKTANQCVCAESEVYRAGERNEAGSCPCKIGHPFDPATGKYNLSACCAPDGSVVGGGAGCCTVIQTCADESDTIDLGYAEEICADEECSCSCSGSSGSSCKYGSSYTRESQQVSIDYQSGNLFQFVQNQGGTGSFDCPDSVEGCRGNCSLPCTSKGQTCRQNYKLSNCRITSATSDSQTASYSCTMSWEQRTCSC